MEFCRSSSVVPYRSLMILAVIGIMVPILAIPVAHAQEKIGMGDQLTVTITKGGNQNYSIGSQATTQPTAGINDTSYGIQSPQIMHTSYNTSYQKNLADSTNPITVQTDKHLYEPGYKVEVSGTVWSGLISTVGGINTLSIQVRDSNDSVVYSGKSHLETDNSYSLDFQIPNNAKNGWFTLETKADVSQDVLNTLTFKLQAGLDTITKFVIVAPTSWPVNIDGNNFQINIASNSNVSNVNFDEQSKKISFIVTGESGTDGIADITIPKPLLSGEFTVMMDGQLISQTSLIEIDTPESTTLEINYHHSNHKVEIVGTNAVPEFPISTIILGVAMASILVMFISRTRKLKFY